MKDKKNIILFVGNVYDDYMRQIIKFKQKDKSDFCIGLVIDSNTKHKLSNKYKKELSFIIKCDSSDKDDIKEKLKSIKNSVLDAYIIYDKHVEFFIDVIKILGLKNYSSPKALRDSVDKLRSRKMFCKYCPEITPKFIKVKSKKDALAISKKIGFPCMLKPAHLVQSRLVSVSNNLAELKINLEKTYKEIDKIYEKIRVRNKPIIIAEEMVKGDLYTVDVYVDKNQKMYFTPLIYQITGKDIGIDDFHIFARINPSNLNKKDTKNAIDVATKSILAIDLKNILIHVEFMKAQDDWKIIEVGPRIGGYRIKMLEMSYNIKHMVNYLFLRTGKKPIIDRKLLNYLAVIEIFSQKEGKITSIRGLCKVKQLKCFLEMQINKNIGDEVGLAKDGYMNVLYVVLENKN
ncbi:MAG: ATP-grasp domain-containing protein, partial [Patescibacteria group bacterium]|nr:ATP-grasp domain-containing protein [Patescibacteria group bacterium]